MRRRVTAILAWGALALLIGVPSTEYLLSQRAGAPEIETALVWQGSPSDEAQTSVVPLRHVDGALVISGGDVTAEILPPIPDVSLDEKATISAPLTDVDNGVDAQSVAGTLQQNNLAVIESEKLDFIPPYPTPYLVRRTGIPVRVSVMSSSVRRESAKATVKPFENVKNERSIFLQDWREQPGLAPPAEIAQSGEAVDPFRFGEFIPRRQTLHTWRAASQTSETFETGLPAKRGNKIRLDLFQGTR